MHPIPDGTYKYIRTPNDIDIQKEPTTPPNYIDIQKEPIITPPNVIDVQKEEPITPPNDIVLTETYYCDVKFEIIILLFIMCICIAMLFCWYKI
jgi:hypothetical protein